MATVLRHPRTTRGTRARRDATTVIRWPRGLALIGLCALLVSAWGGIVPYVGPAFGYSSNGAPAWDWTLQHALLYLVPGAVGVLFSLGVLSRAGGGRGLARAHLGLSGLVLVACGAWFVIGPVTWPIWHPAAAVFGHGTTPTAHFVNEIGYNLGVGVVLAALGGMVMKALTGEREIAAVPVAADAPAGAAYAGDRYADPAYPADRTMADTAATDRTVAGPAGQPVGRHARTGELAGEPAVAPGRTVGERNLAAPAGEPVGEGLGTHRSVTGSTAGGPAAEGAAYPAGSTADDAATTTSPMTGDPAAGAVTDAPATPAQGDETRQL
jgi:hypothetical protein